MGEALDVKSKISVVINTYNEETNISNAIESVRNWVDEVIVCDMLSEDKTVEIAKELGAKIYYFEKMQYADPAREFAVSKAINEWILILDADEMIPKRLSEKLVEFSSYANIDVLFIPTENYFFGSPLKYTGWGPTQDFHPRFFRKDKLHLSPKIHDYMSPSQDARVKYLDYEPGLAMIHFNYLDLSHFIEKMNRYTTIEANSRKNEKINEIYALFKSFRGFLRRYIKLKGFKDGWKGFYLSLFWGFYILSTFAKIKELNNVGTRRDVLIDYHKISKDILREYYNK